MECFVVPALWPHGPAVAQSVLMKPAVIHRANQAMSMFMLQLASQCPNPSVPLSLPTLYTLTPVCVL